jgi:glycosyltransferase involved in cell wall biosynthesis
VSELVDHLEGVGLDDVQRGLVLGADDSRDLGDRPGAVGELPDSPTDVVESEVLAGIAGQEKHGVAGRLRENTVATAGAALRVHRLRYIEAVLGPATADAPAGPGALYARDERDCEGGALKVLYVERTGLVGGGERSLLGLLDGTAGQIERVLACPSGPLQAASVAHGVPVVTIPETAGSLRLHPWHTTAGVATMASAALAIWRAARGAGIDLMHANSIRAGLVAAPAARRLGVPLVVHVRDRLPPSAMTTAVRRAVVSSADAIVAISRFVAEEFDPSGSAARLRVIDNPLDLARFDPALVTREHARDRLDVPLDVPLIGLIGQLTPWKGQDDAIRALAKVRERHRDARLVIVGEPKFVARATRFDNWAFVRHLHELVRDLGLGWSVSFLGEREDVPEIIRALDLLLVPSWEEPFGRTVIESMAMATPVLATSVGGPREVITDGVDGRLLAPRDPDAWGTAITEMLSDEAGRAAMGQRARNAVRSRFGLAAHADAVTALYREVLTTGSGS